MIGAELLPHLLAKGHAVTALTRNERNAEALREQGAEAVVGDALDRDAVRRLVVAARPEAVVHQLTAIPPRIPTRRAAAALALTARLRREGTRHLIDAAREAGARRFVAQSIAFAYRPRPGGPHDEGDPLHLDAHPSFADVNRAAKDLEDITTETPGIEGVALRYGSFYGKGSVFAPGGSVHEDVLARRVPIVGDGGGVFSFIHLADAAVATEHAIVGTATGIFNVVDDDPAPVGTWLPVYAELAGAKPPMRVPRWLARLGGGAYAVYLFCDQRGATAARFKETFGWKPAHASWREGFRELLSAR